MRNHSTGVPVAVSNRFVRTGEASAEECAYTFVKYQSPQPEGDRTLAARGRGIGSPYA